MSVRLVAKGPVARRAFAVLALASAGALGGCANPAADEALAAQTALIGMSKATLLSCAGVPERQATVGNQEFFTYRSSRIVSYPSTPPIGYYGGWGWPYYGYGYGWPSYGYEVNSFDCEATFSLRNGVVERVVYGGASGGSARLGQCYAIVQNCMALIPQRTIKPSP
ncbi:hypothetical protein ACCD06_05170 [Azospirillum sp. CT11-132]|uniref:hypothetical protein n=1 Tax=unclassified Azospirillum TaxID=2630922 RepID=UPI000D60ACEC|nr:MULTISPECIES: hypothetical protein [unclassified Azospirillum]PWC59639.1 hypothetical protein TSH20_27295 [Azospirillum sp. TSH20]PWC65699.1 hypothetical protein TSH7_08030 [Azospirillum sp. TSH7]